MAARKVGIHPKPLADWFKRSRAGDAAYEIAWHGFRLPFHEHAAVAIDEAFDELIVAAWEWTSERLIFKLDPQLVARGFEGTDADLHAKNGQPMIEAIYRVRNNIRFSLENGLPEKWGKNARA